jgi:hypothetical protein
MGRWVKHHRTPARANGAYTRRPNNISAVREHRYVRMFIHLKLTKVDPSPGTDDLHRLLLRR